MAPRDEYPEDSEVGGPAPRRYPAIYAPTNGNGSVNKIVWGAAALFVVILVTINGFMWKSQIDLTREVASRLATLEAQMTIVLSRQQQ